ncbi:hypothetical protein [Bacillus dakarensis]|uniref:hypothetical protein n=1 Tax=Robertmurraya dakarensis TaxID=1926278 RepID=UPI0009811F58|nr:hypothetical protein [Bacillus dakarensis]
MKGLSIIMMISLLFITTACQKEKLKIDSSTKQIVFFTDESKYQIEAPYYDAIIALKQQFPEEIKNMLILPPSKAKDYYDTFKVKECPAIIVMYNDQVVARVDGEISREQIVKPISSALSKSQ